MQPTYVTKQNQGRDFVRSVIAKSLGWAGPDLESAAVARWGLMPAQSIIKASGLGTADLTPDQGVAAEQFFDQVLAGSVVGKLGLRRVEFNIRMLSMTAGVSGYWVTQAAPKPLSKPTLSGSTLRTLKVSAMVVVTAEAMRTMGNITEAALQRDLQRALSETLDVTFIDSSNAGVVDEMPASITSGVTPIPSTGQPEMDLHLLIAEFEGSLDSSVFITDPVTATVLALHRDSGGSFPFIDAGPRGGSLFGIPLVTSHSSPRDTDGGQIALIDPSLIALATGSVRLDQSGQTSLAMADSPEAPAEMVSLYQTDSVCLRAELEANWQVQNPAAVAVLTGVAYGAS